MEEKLLKDGTYLSSICTMLEQVEQQEQAGIEAAAKQPMSRFGKAACCMSFLQGIRT